MQCSLSHQTEFLLHVSQVMFRYPSMLTLHRMHYSAFTVLTGHRGML